MYSPTPPLEPIEAIEQQPQRQDSLDDQLRDLWRAAIKLGCYDAADWLRALLDCREQEGLRPTSISSRDILHQILHK